MTYGETEAMKAAWKEHPGMSDAQLRETPEYREVMKGYGTGSTPQMVVQAITGVLGGLNAGNPGQVLAGGLNPAVAQLIKQSTGDNREANLMAHAVWGALAAQLGGNNAASGAAGAFSGELAARYIIDNYYGGRTDNLSEQERQQISMLATIASGIAGGLVGNSTSAAGTGAQAGRNSVENNALSELVPPRVQQDASLAFDLSGKGVTNDEIIKAVDKSHIGPSVGDTAKIHGDVKGQVAGGYVAGGYLEGVLSEDKFSINGGVTKVLGWRADVSAGLTFGPYPIKDFNPTYDYSGAISTGIFSVEGSIGKDGFGGSFRVGGGIGASIDKVKTVIISRKLTVLVVPN